MATAQNLLNILYKTVIDPVVDDAENETVRLLLAKNEMKARQTFIESGLFYAPQSKEFNRVYRRAYRKKVALDQAKNKKKLMKYTNKQDSVQVYRHEANRCTKTMKKVAKKHAEQHQELVRLRLR
jgi:hypothetical protein